ncbi:Coiled-coil domain-containing protein 77 [Chamberlinius hualienensis]
MDKYHSMLSDLVSQLQSYLTELNEKKNIHIKIRGIKEQNEELSRTLSRIKTQIYEEKETNLRLRSEVAAFKLEEICSHKKIQMLLGLCNLEEDTVELLAQKDWPKISHLTPTQCCYLPTDFLLQTENEILEVKLKALTAELNERTELLLCERDTLIQDKKNLLLASQDKKLKDDDIAYTLINRLKQVESSCIKLLETALKGKPAGPPSDQKLPEIPHPNEVPNDVKLHNVKLSVESQTNGFFEPNIIPEPKVIPYQSTSKVIRDLKLELKKSKEVEQRLKSRISMLQSEVNKLIKEKPLINQSNQNLSDQIKILTKRNKELENRRKLDNEGFRSDVKMLRDNLKYIEKQLLKIVLAFGEKRNINVDLSAYEALEKSMRGTDELLIKLKDLQAKLN